MSRATAESIVSVPVLFRAEGERTGSRRLPAAAVFAGDFIGLIVVILCVPFAVLAVGLPVAIVVSALLRLFTSI